MPVIDIGFLNLQMQIQQSNNGLSPRPGEEGRVNEQIFELGIKINLGAEEELDRKEIDILLNHILAYPSSEEAERHRDSNRLGILDVDNQEKRRRISNHQMKPEESYNQICGCCGFILQDKDLEVCSHSLADINNLGISTFVYFRTILNVGVLLAIMFIVYSAYSIATNIKASQLIIEGNMSSTALKFLSISLGSKSLYGSEEKRNMYVAGAWIGCGMLVLWGAAFMGLKYYQKQSEVRILMETKSVSEYSMLIEKMPTDLTKQQVQAQLSKYLERIKESEEVSIDQLKLQKYNEGKPFYFNQQEFNSAELKEVVQIYEEYKDLFAEWLLERRTKDQFSCSEKYRNRKYQEFERIIARKEKICSDMIIRIKEEYKKKNKENKTTAFLTFSTNHQKNFILDRNPEDWMSKLKDYIPFLKSHDRFTITKNDVQYKLKIYPAPDPEDIIWSNIGVTNCEIRTRKLVTFTITLVILAISYVIVYALSTVQLNNRENRYISLIISLSISVINLLIGQVIQILTKYERDYTMTNFQTSLAIKSIVAQLANCVFIPIMANYFIKNNIYEENGLIEDVFILSITNSFVAPLVKIFDPYYYLRYFYAKVKLLPSQKLKLHQYELNEICERVEFQVGYEYIYVVNLFIFTCFFVSLQPIIPIFSICGLLLMFWVQKYSLFNRCQRPVPGTKIINTTMSQMIYFGTITFSLGSMTWANFLPTSQFRQALLPNLFSLSMGILIFIVPYESIFRKIFKNKRMPEVFYADNRIFFTSEYDRLNPSTSESGIKQYRQFLQIKRKELQTQRPEVKERLSINLEQSNRPNFYKKPSNLFFSLKNQNNQAIINNLLNRQSQNILTPQMIATVLLPQKTTKPQNYMRRASPAIQNFMNSRSKKHHSRLQMNIDFQQPTEQFWRNAERVENVQISRSVKHSQISNIQPLPSGFTEKRPSQFFEEMMKVKSYLVRDNKVRGEEPIEEERRESAEEVGDNKIRQIQKLSIQSKDEDISVEKSREVEGINSKMKQTEEKKDISFRESMINEFRETFNHHEEICNRFSINADRILPICLDPSAEKDAMGDSDIKIYELGCFQ